MIETVHTDIKRFTNLEMSDYVKQNNIKSYTELLALGNTRKDAGQTDIAEFIFNHQKHSIQELISKTWEMAAATNNLAEDQINKFQRVQKQLEEPCATSCNGQWLQYATEVLLLNNIMKEEFATSVRNLLMKGRGKHRNILIVGPPDSAKTFMLKPLQTIFKDRIFENPSADKFAWIGADKAHVILLNRIPSVL